MNLRPAMASKLRSVYTKWVLEAKVSRAKLAEAGMEKAYTALKLLENGNADEALGKAIALRRDDLRDEVSEEENGEVDCQLSESRYAYCKTHKRHHLVG